MARRLLRTAQAPALMVRHTRQPLLLQQPKQLRPLEESRDTRTVLWRVHYLRLSYGLRLELRLRVQTRLILRGRLLQTAIQRLKPHLIVMGTGLRFRAREIAATAHI